MLGPLLARHKRMMRRIRKTRFEEVSLKTLKTKTAQANLQPVWCHHCCIRIAPYDMKTVFRGKDYHRDCYAKVSHAHGKSSKN